jgi:ribosomal protein S1
VYLTTNSLPCTVAEGAVVTGKVTGLATYGALVRIDASTRALLHVSNMAGDSFAEREARLASLKFGDVIEALVTKISEPEGSKPRRVSVSEKALKAHRAQEMVTRTAGAPMTLSVIRSSRDGLVLKLSNGFEGLLPDANLKGTRRESILKSRRTQVRLVGVDGRGRIIAEKA